jgi:4-hydroxybenzoate polyprenyltransferase
MAEMTSTTEAARIAERPRASLLDYVRIARPDHWIKHAFILPGIAVALLLRPVPLLDRLGPIVVGMLAAATIASANYVLNEWLDAGHDAHHPTKSNRPAVRTQMSRTVIILEYLALLTLGLLSAAWVSPVFLGAAVAFMVSGWVYNIPPVRTKSRVYLDVLSEAANSPIRLTFGWTMIDGMTLPPGSLLLAFWMGGAYLMSIKRFAEQRTAQHEKTNESLKLYRESFRSYTAESLLLSSFLYAQLAAFFLAVFLIKYRIEYLLAFPFLAGLFTIYLWLGLRKRSPTQTPEKLIKNRALLATVSLAAIALLVLTFVDIPVLEKLTRPHLIDLSGP